MPDTLLGGIVINEILVDPNGALNFDTDGNGTADATDEYIELYNTSGSPIDISGLELWDAGVGQWFVFPPGTILAAGGHAMVLSGVQAGGALPTGDPGDLFFDAGRGSPLINNGGDNVTLYDPTNDEFVQATYNGDALDDPTLGASGYSGFSGTATRIGSGEDFGNDTDGQSCSAQGMVPIRFHRTPRPRAQQTSALLTVQNCLPPAERAL
ncbi:MAG: lamin tail domain-containing protein [Planktotalea sp.]|uniref:lamin tail domain-containing protein n=1 Tax=Planktotalea sp. TaxID=2029877 RepID=UPI003C766E84